MKKIQFILFVNIIALNIYAQETTIYHKDIELKEIGTLIDGEKDGEWKTYDTKSGNLVGTMLYKNKQKVERRSYYKSGELKELISLSKKRTKMRLFYKNGKLRFSKVDTLNGKYLWKYYNDQGIIIYDKVAIEYDGKDGEYKNYYPSGKLKEIQNYTDNKKNGNCKYYFEGGQLGGEGNYINGKLIGNWKIYDTNGKLIDKKHKTFYDSGELKKVGLLDKNGKKIGEWKVYQRDGNISDIIWFNKDSNVIKISKYYFSGILRKFIIIKNDTTVLFKRFFKGGDLSSILKPISKEKKIKKDYDTGYDGRDYYLTEETILNNSGIRDGLAKTYYENGQLKEIVFFINGKEEGEALYYFEGGKLGGIGNYKKGLKTGEFKLFYDNEKLKRIGTYQNNNKHGKWKYYNKEGLLKKEEHFDNGVLNGPYQRYVADIDSFILKNMKIIYPYKNYLIEEGNYKNGAKIGKWKTYNSKTGTHIATNFK